MYDDKNYHEVDAYPYTVGVEVTGYDDESIDFKIVKLFTTYYNEECDYLTENPQDFYTSEVIEYLDIEESLFKREIPDFDHEEFADNLEELRASFTDQDMNGLTELNFDN